MIGKDRSLTSLLNDSHIRGIFFQILLALGLVFLGSWLVDNTLTNLSNQGKTLGFDFLTRTAGFQIIPTLGTWMFDYEVGKSNYIDVYLIGIVNTFVVAFWVFLRRRLLVLPLALCAFRTIWSLKGSPLPLLRFCGTFLCFCSYFSGISPCCARCRASAKNWN